MSDPSKAPTLFSDAIRAELTAIVEEAVSKAMKNGHVTVVAVEERMLDIEEAAKVISVSPEWLYRNRKRLPFTRKLGPKMLRFSYAGLLRWTDSKKFS
jgi:predicted DNA-binding transcriptional regulator AlpA